MGPRSQTGSSVKHDDSQSGWSDNPRAAFAVRTAVFLAPLVLAFLSTWLVTRRWEAPDSTLMAILRFVVLAVIAMGVGAAADKVARRFLPLAALLRLSLVFPDQAPSRFIVALRSGSTRRLEARLAEIETSNFTGSEAEAAQLIVELAASLSRHDRLTRGHSERVRAYTALIAEEMGLPPEESNRLQWAGLIHDVGKLRIPYEILTKPGELTEREFEIIKTHPAEGMRIAAPLAGFLGPWIGAVGEHHERVDGNGYPQGLSGQQISLGARIVAVADAYDVMTAANSYKKSHSPAWARKELARCAGTQFDPVVVRAFLNVGLGPVRRSMWPLSWVVQVPFLGTAVTAPVTQAVTASVLTLATATGVTAATGGFAPIDFPAALAMVQTGDSDAQVADQQLATTTTSLGTVFTTTIVATTTTNDGTTTSIADTTSTSIVAPTTSTTTSSSTTTVAPTTTTEVTLPPVTTTTEVVIPPVTIESTTTTALALPISDCERAQAGDTELANADLSECVLAGQEFVNGNFDGADFSGAVLEGVTMTGGSFVSANFAGVQMVEVDASGSNFESANFQNAVISAGEFADSLLINTNFDGAFLEWGSMLGSNLDQGSFAGATLMQWSLKEAHLVGVDFTETIFIDSSIKYAIADHAIFHRAMIENLWVHETSFTETDFSEAEGVPLYHESAFYEGAICPTGDITWQTCW